MDRRDFLGSLVAAGAVLAAGPLSVPDASGAEIKLGPIGLQLYTVRGEMKKNFGGTLARVAEIGYREVEFAGYFGYGAKTVHAALRQNGLVSPSSHIGIPVLGKEWAGIIDDALTIGQKYLICAWIDDKYRTLAGYREIAALFNKAGEQSMKAGIQFGYHNHSYEFQAVEGVVPYDLLLRETDPSLVAMQMDVFWLRSAGRDPVSCFRQYPGRFPSLHIKDMDAAGKMVDVGKGVIPWRAILEKRELAGVKHIFVEHDEPAEAFRSIRDSYRYLRSLDT